MATILTPNQNEEENQTQSQAPAAGQPLNISSGQTQQSQAAPKAKGSGRFTNLQKYLDVNKQGGSQLSQGIGQTIQKEIEPQKQQSSDYYSKLGQSIQQSQGALNQGAGYLGQLQQANQNLQQSGLNANLGLNNLQNNQSFGAVKSGSAVNENLLQSQQAGLANAAKGYMQSSSDALSNLQSEGGRFNLLKRTFGGNANPQYNVGQQRLDQLFLSRQGLNPLMEDVRGNLQESRDLYNQATKLGTDVSNIAGQEQQLMEDISGQASDLQSNFGDLLEQQYQQASQKQLEDVARLRAGLESKNLSSEDMKNLGILGGTQNLYTLNPMDYFKGSEAPTVSSVMNKEQLAKYNAINNLTGSAGRFGELSEVGGFKPYEFDAGGFMSDRQAIENQALSEGNTPVVDSRNTFRQYDYATANIPGMGFVNMHTLTPLQAVQIMDTYNSGLFNEETFLPVEGLTEAGWSKAKHWLPGIRAIAEPFREKYSPTGNILTENPEQFGNTFNVT